MIKPIYLLRSKRALIAFSLIFGLSPVFAQTVIVSGTTLRVEPGTSFVEGSGLGMTSAGTIDNKGTINLKGNFTNNGVAALGTGTFVFNGTTNQTITGTNTMANMTVNNAAGVTMAGETTVNGVLTLTSGLVTLGTNNLTLGTGATVSGTPAAANMVVATGTGELRKQFAGTGTFVYPVGDNTATAEYSPVTLNFSAGTFAGGAYAGVNLVNAIYPDPNITVDYLNRYWKLSQTGITGFTCQADFKYPVADVQGTEANIYTVKINPSPVVTYNPTVAATHTLTAPGLTSFSTFTGMRGAHTVTLTAFLEGPNTGTGAMTTALPAFTAGAPFFSTSPFPLTQPYAAAPWNYAGTENVGTVPTGVVDWVYIELRQGLTPASATAATIFAKRAAFIKSDGSIVDIDGINPVKFYGGAPATGNNVYMVIKHRNHLAIMSNIGVTKNTQGVFLYDFTDVGTKSYGFPFSIKNVGGKWSMIAANGFYDADINTDDKDFSWTPQFGSFNGYYSGDFNLSGQVDTDDADFYWYPNFGGFTPFNDGMLNKYHSMVP